MEKRITPKGQSYYGSTGAYQKEYDEVVKKLIPGHGEAETKHGEMVRIIDNLTQDFFEQDLQNSVDAVTEDCPECGGSGWEVTNWRDKNKPDYEEEKDDCSVCGGNCTIRRGGKFNRYFGGRFIYLTHALPYNERGLMDKLEEFLLKGRGEETVLDEVADSVMHFVLNSENEPR
jgi:hypothetical protein